LRDQEDIERHREGEHHERQPRRDALPIARHQKVREAEVEVEERHSESEQAQRRGGPMKARAEDP
jgi:hypothetical protein